MLTMYTAELITEAINIQAGYSLVSVNETKWMEKVEIPRNDGYEVFALQKNATTILVHPVKIGETIRYSVQFVKW